EFDLPLGNDYILARVSIRKYSCVGMATPYIDVMLDLIAKHSIAWDDVASVEHHINQARLHSFRYDQPTTAEEARFSLTHMTVACFFDRNVFLPTFTDEKATDPLWHEARKKVKVTLHPEWPAESYDFDIPVTITMKNGRRYQAICHSVRG